MARAPVAPRYHARTQALCLKMPDQSHHQRGFSRAANYDIAYHNDGNAKTFGRQNPALVQRPAQSDQKAVYLRYRPEEASKPAASAPGFQQMLFHAFGFFAGKSEVRSFISRLAVRRFAWRR